jgi:SnoaL-like domain
MREMTAEPGARAWVEAWTDGWRRHDPAVIAARYAPGARFRSLPFRAEGRGPEAVIAYTSEAFREERTARFAFGEPIVAPDGRAAVEYRAVIVPSDGGPETTIAGVSVLRFDAAGLVTEHFDCWAEAPGDQGIDIHPEAPA